MHLCEVAGSSPHQPPPAHPAVMGVEYSGVVHLISCISYAQVTSGVAERSRPPASLAPGVCSALAL